MKLTSKNIIFFCTISIICITGCSKHNNSLIVGTWDEVKVHNYMDSAGILTEDSSVFTSPYFTITLTPDGQYAGIVPRVDTLRASYTFSGNTLTLFIPATGTPRAIKEIVSDLQSGSMNLTEMDTFFSSGQQVTAKRIFYYSR